MFITFREKSIIELIVRTSGKHTVHSLSTYLNVSVRTIQRDLKSVEKLLMQFDLVLKRTANDGLFIDGKNEQIYRLIQNLTSVRPTDETPEERKLNLLITLLHDGPSFKKQVLANQLGVSTATLSAYLNDLAEWIGKFSITLTRKRGVGVEVGGEEANKRHALANYFLIHFYEEIIENLYQLQLGKPMEGNVLGYFSPRYLTLVDGLVNEKINKEQGRLADSDYIGLVIHTCLTIQRTEQGFLLQQEDETANEYTSEYELINGVADELESALSIALTGSDIHFLSIILRGSKVQAADLVYYDNVLLGKLIKNMILDVSSSLHVNLADDFSLYQGLLAHMGPSIFRLKQKLELFNPLTEEIKRKYPMLFMAVKKSLETEFPDIDFPADEIAFIVLHFGSALLMNEERIKLNAIVVCPTGIGTSKMLASRIQKELVEIDSVAISSINDFQSGNFHDYDIVISTIRLPVTDVDYIMVSPLLSDRDIRDIENYLQDHLEKIISRKRYLNAGNQFEEPAQPNQPNVQTLLQEIKDVHSSMESILTNLKVYRKQQVADHRLVLQEMVEQSTRDGLITNPESVQRELEEREKKGGLGIPDTNIGLFHCRDESIRELIFQVAHLDKPCPIKGMDGETVHMNNLLLMLAPVSMSVREQEILSLISSSLIESDVAMMIFSSSNENMIRKKLEDLFLDYLQHNLIKE
ncbi:BglG family transcription antiterminator [Planococcus lenghuensis]|uniref:Sugar transporter n=1 Tax=Planococcus lenghuensis TaxID=2213202 RepID=A0A1Q2L370_9BACL|nr:PRD domain-containing protein [Planococcus lenghuensis]AQQ54890.1 sugar transporter [Planococcus lenghuensis]